MDLDEDGRQVDPQRIRRAVGDVEDVGRLNTSRNSATRRIGS
ncbi:hypothetical protein ACWEPC_44965 [Nonomuraea sp. NPDC004297]